MAARKRNWQTNKTREKIRDSIKTRQIVERLEKHILKSEGEEGYVDLKPTQIKAGQALLDRTMPVLSSAEITEIIDDKSPEELISFLETILPSEMLAVLKAKFLPQSHQDHANGPH